MSKIVKVDFGKTKTIYKSQKANVALVEKLYIKAIQDSLKQVFDIEATKTQIEQFNTHLTEKTSQIADDFNI